MHPASILIIDDEPVVCDGCRLVLAGIGHTVDHRLTGEEGLARLQQGDCDLLLLDMKLPDIGGMAVLEAVVRDHPAVHVIVMTGYSTVQNAVAAMKQGAVDYLAKPFSDDDLIASVERALESKRLAEENLALRKQRFERFEFANIVGENDRIREIFTAICKIAPTDSTVLLEGESGTGKELFARAIHAHSRRAARQFVAADCSTFADSLLESELFGHVKGAFTGAIGRKAGIFEVADGGTLFLDEVANLSLDVQSKLLRVMETHEFRPVGASRPLQTDVRIIAATHRNLKKRVAEDRFREDLYYRLNVLPIHLPPLRERRDDIPKLAYHFLRQCCRETGKRIEGFTDDALKNLIAYDWPGNIRQLKNVVERLVVMADGNMVRQEDLADHMHLDPGGPHPRQPRTLAELKSVKKRIIEARYMPIEKEFLAWALSEAEGNITRAASRTGMQRSNFSALMKKHGLTRKGASPD